MMTNLAEHIAKRLKVLAPYMAEVKAGTSASLSFSWEEGWLYDANQGGFIKHKDAYSEMPNTPGRDAMLRAIREAGLKARVSDDGVRITRHE